MSADGAVFIGLILAAAAVIGGGWFALRGRGNVSFEPARTLALGDELLPANDHATGRSVTGVEEAASKVPGEDASTPPAALSAEETAEQIPAKDGP